MSIFAYASPPASTKPPPAPPAPRAPAVLAQRQAREREIEVLNASIGERALAACEGKSGGKEGLAALHEKIRAVTFEIECNAAAHELAVRLDKQAVADWKASIQAMPAEDIVAGITTSACCGLCSTSTGCVITGFGSCGHPVKVGALNPAQQGDAGIRRVYRAACQVKEHDND